MEWEDSSGLHPNVAKFLGFLGKAEGADYNTIVGGSSFSDFSKHPEVVGLRTKEGPSTAAGRYQITKTTYKDTAPALGITDFSQKSQDLIATELIRRKNALDDVVKGDFDAAINKLGGVWASLPSSPYSQPKRDWNFVKANLTGGGGGGWEDAPRAASSGGGWEDAPAPTQAVQSAAPQAAPQPASAKAPAPTAPKRTAAESFGLGTRNVLEGVEQAFTYPVRAVGEAASGIAGLLGKKELADTISRTVGMKNKGAGALLADTAGLAKPETKTEKVIAEGTKAAAGLLSGSVVNKLAEKSPEVVKGVLNMIMPGTSGTAGQVAKDVGIFGGLGASMEAAPAETAAGIAALAAGKAGAGRVIGPRVSDFLDNRAANKLLDAAGPRNVRQDAEIVRRLSQEFDDPLRAVSGSARPLGTKELNGKIEQSFLREGQDLVAQLPKDFAGKKTLETALTRGVKNTTDEIDALRNVSGGEQVADLIEAAKRTQAVTSAVASTGGIMPAVRYGVQKALPGFLSEPINAVIGKRQTREAVGQKLVDTFARGANKVEQRFGLAPSKVATQELQGIVKEADNTALANIMGAKREQSATKRLADEAAAKAASQKEAEKLLKQQEGLMIREGGQIIAERKAAEKAAERAARVPSAGGTGSKSPMPQASIADLQAKDPTYLLGLGNRLGSPRNATEMAEFSKVMQNQMEARAQKALSNREVQKTVAELAKGPRVDPRIQVLQDSRRPLSGAFQELLPGGRSGLNLQSDQAIEALRLTSRQFKDRPLGQAAQDILRSGNVNDEAAFYGLQNQLRKLQERGVVSGQPGALSSATANIRNPVSYAEAVRTAGEAANLARASAPTKELAQFATKVAGIKSPADKAKAVADRLAKSNDPAEQAFLTQFVEPLAQFGKK